ncbi:esterase [Streptomyces sp. WAC 01529]|uniref:alpha/beta fold hydrolase n=1 Tax=Streptomyces sp. WAC 01529 TaxID=2203205 RepID=UPI000F70FB19|nr:alpha/beta hydrolase [Streptomyces sp. WAC 01529]AZM52900.1 esterase [Streptomyces sp. WAC 01529]
MVNFVLVAGARLGAWAWDEVVPYLRAAGHGVFPLTLSGLAEKRGVFARQATHVQDIVSEVERRDLRDVVLVGHSYSGIPVGQAAERIGDRLSRVVFVDSSIPVDGESFVSAWPDGGAAVKASIAENGGFWPLVSAAHYDGEDLTDEQIARLIGGATPHPGATLTEPAVLAKPLGELPATYILCLPDDADSDDADSDDADSDDADSDDAEPDEDVAELLKSEHWRLAKMNTGHWPMFSQPRELAQVLIASAEE